MEQYDMSREVRGKVMQFAKDNNLPLPGNIYKGIYTALIVQHKLSIIMQEIDETLDRIMLLNDRVRMVIEEGNLTVQIAQLRKLAGADVEILEFTLVGPVLAVRPYCHNDNYWQVYFDTNRVGYN